MKNFVPFIFASGLGTRLRPLTYETPKPLLPVYKGMSMLEINILRLLKSGFDKVYVNYSYKKGLFDGLVEKYRGKIEIILLDNTEVSGHGGILKKYQNVFGKGNTILGFNGDTYADVVISDLMKKIKSGEVVVFSDNRVVELPKELLCYGKNLEGIEIKGEKYFYVNTGHELKNKNNVGVYAIPVDLLFKLKSDESYLGFFGKDDLFEMAVGAGYKIKCLDVVTRGFWSFNTAEEYGAVRENIRLGW